MLRALIREVQAWVPAELAPYVGKAITLAVIALIGLVVARLIGFVVSRLFGPGPVQRGRGGQRRRDHRVALAPAPAR